MTAPKSVDSRRSGSTRDAKLLPLNPGGSRTACCSPSGAATGEALFSFSSAFGRARPSIPRTIRRPVDPGEPNDGGFSITAQLSERRSDRGIPIGYRSAPPHQA